MTISDDLRDRVLALAGYECGYCRVSEDLIYAPMEIDHIQPKKHGGSDDEANLWVACPRCNSFKHSQFQAVDPMTGAMVLLFNPRFQRWHEHFTWGKDHASIVGQTPCGRATVSALQLNFEKSVQLRRVFVQYGWYPPKDT